MRAGRPAFARSASSSRPARVRDNRYLPHGTFPGAVPMGLFGRKKENAGGATTTTMSSPKMSGWQVECGPTCGFLVRDHNKDELAKMVQMHMKDTHKTNLTPTEALKDAKTVNW